ncbi:hypothetical protein EYC59_03820 [Candidatus Saccharibacteria bacterium]|nr:MAG: hypothetical protein EYC59_03820 [Candidatus Saccharibacteria bacterium]
MNRVHKHLKLHHHKHTGKVLHHRHTSYWALVLVVVLAGACMLLTNRMAQAADYVVTAKISAPLPAGAPVITSPADGTVFDSPTVNINGTCPLSTPAILIVIYEGTTALGTAQCTPLGTFSVPVTLHAGTQQLVATVVNITDDVGDSSTPLTLGYTPKQVPTPVTPTTPSTTTPSRPHGQRSTPRGSGEQELEIRSRSPFIVYGPSKPAVWRGSFAGGQPPYTANIAWGDGKTSWLKQVGAEPQEVSHSYTEVKSAYRVTITLRDSGGHEIQMRLLAVSPTTASGTLTPTLNTPLPFSHLLYFLYLLTILVLLGLWALEHRENLRTVPVPVAARKKRAQKNTAAAKRARRR